MWKWDDFHAEGDQSWWDQETKQQLSVKESPDLNNQSGGSTSWTPPPRHLWGSATWIHGPGLDCQHRLLLPETDRWKWPKLGSSPVCRLQFTENGWIFLATPLALFMLCIIRAISAFLCVHTECNSLLPPGQQQAVIEEVEVHWLGG